MSEEKPMKKIKLVLSDLHLGAGMFLSNGEHNLTENFYFDRELAELIRYFSSGKYGEGAPVELILNGDILDFLTINYKEYYSNIVTEKMSIYKLKKIIKGHNKVFDALRYFISLPNKTIVYNVGNHDADLFFPGVRKLFAREVGGQNYQDKISFVFSEEYYKIEGNIEIHHGHQFEAMHSFNYKQPIVKDHKGRDVLNLPWGSLYVMNVINKFKREDHRDYLDKVSPIFLMLVYALVTDFRFILKFMFYTCWYWLKTRWVYFYFRKKKINAFFRFFKIMNEEFFLLDDGESAGKSVLKSRPETYAVIMGHTHKPKQVFYPNGQIYVNTGTWLKTIHFDLNYFGKSVHLPFCLIEYEEGEEKPRISLFEWKGVQSHFRPFLY